MKYHDTNNNEIKFNEKSFKKAIVKCKIIRWENIFKDVVKAYLDAESEIVKNRTKQ